MVRSPNMWLGIGLLVRADLPGLSRLSLALAAAVAGVGVAANLTGRDVTLGIIFTLWTAWWIWLMVLLLRLQRPLR